MTGKAAKQGFSRVAQSRGAGDGQSPAGARGALAKNISLGGWAGKKTVFE